ncbi:MAG TPA: peptidylprolyl isomerase, partial [Pyrinomonadaceae bacterium]|nr:peptidylprolyl isomerase [Pyrinomonadaceae bacterium]
ADILHERAGGVTAPPQESQLVKRSVSRDGLVKALQLDGLSVEELSNLIKLRGVAFKVTPEVEAELREAGATPELIATARASYRDTSLERRVETVNTRNHREDYERAAARAGKNVRAVVSTDKGALTIELLAEDAPLTVDNFVQLARRNYFNGITFHRVVPNFVIQGGDPRGDGNGGPGYQIRCEINMAPYGRGAVGMALSGKDTGGSQWFVTHSPQPHLDGGYTVFGRVVEGLEVVDRIARGDRIRGIQIIESKMNRK